MLDDPRTRATLLLVAAVLLWSTSGLLIKLSSWNALALTGGRSALAALVLLAYLRGRPRFTWTAAQIGGALAYFGTQTFFVAATQTTSATNAILLQHRPHLRGHLRHLVPGRIPETQ